MERFGVIADDFTGANDAGVQFKKRGLRTVVVVKANKIESVLSDTDVVVVDTESRMLTPKTAYKKVREAVRALKEADVRVVYKKIDSTLKGNIGSELDAIMDEMETNSSLVAPAFPSNERITVGGYHLIDQVPLERTDLAGDLVNPLKQSYVPALIQDQTKRKVGHVPLSTVMAGFQSLKQALIEREERGEKVIVVDTVTQEDLGIIAGVGLKLNLLPCGSAGLAEEISIALRPASGPILVISGSVNNVTMRQISKAKSILTTHVVELDTFRIIGNTPGQKKELQRVVKTAVKAMNSGKDVIVKSAKSREHATRTLQNGKKKGFTAAEVSEQISSFLAETVEALIKTEKISGLALIGGDTAVKIVEGIGALGTRIEREVLPGIPACRLIGGQRGNLRTITKAGGFGDENALIRMIKCLKEPG